MKAQEVADLLIARLPREAEWDHMRGEPYGAYNMPPRREVSRVLYCVTPTQAVVDLFHQRDYDLLISHHPFIGGRGVPQLVFHTALDCGEGGLNDQWRDMLGVKDPQHFDGTLGWHGKIDPLSFEALCAKIEAWMGAPIAGQKFTKIETVESVVICTGLGGMVVPLALKSGADCYILGEATQSAESTGFRAMIEIGHTLSERVGLKVFQETLSPHGIQVDGAPLEIDRYSREVYQRPRPIPQWLPDDA